MKTDKTKLTGKDCCYWVEQTWTESLRISLSTVSSALHYKEMVLPLSCITSSTVLLQEFFRVKLVLRETTAMLSLSNSDLQS